MAAPTTASKCSAKLHAIDPRLRVIRFRRNFGQTAAFAAGFAHARGRVIVTSDGDLQNDPRDIPAIVAKLESGYDIVCGWRKKRKDAFVSRTVPSMLANRLISWATGVRLHDYGCSLKAFRAEVVKPLRLYGEMHRFIPAIASEQGVAIAEVVVNHRSRRHGASNYGISRTIRVVLDLLTVKFLLSYSTRPLQIFGLIGFVMALLGVIAGAWLTFVKFVGRRTGDRRPSAAAAGDSPDLHGRAAGHARTARGDAGAHLPRVAEEADVRHPRGPRSGPDIVTEKRSGGGQRRIAWVLLLASAAAVLVTGLFGTVLVLSQLGGGPGAAVAGVLAPAHGCRRAHHRQPDAAQPALDLPATAGARSHSDPRCLHRLLRRAQPAADAIAPGGDCASRAGPSGRAAACRQRPSLSSTCGSGCSISSRSASSRDCPGDRPRAACMPGVRPCW